MDRLRQKGVDQVLEELSDEDDIIGPSQSSAPVPKSVPVDPSFWDHGGVDEAPVGSVLPVDTESSDPRLIEGAYDDYRQSHVLVGLKEGGDGDAPALEIKLPLQRDLPVPIRDELILAMCCLGKDAFQASLTPVVAMWMLQARIQCNLMGAPREVMTPAMLAGLTLAGLEAASIRARSPEAVGPEWKSLEQRASEFRPWSELIEELWRSFSRCASDPHVLFYRRRDTLMGCTTNQDPRSLFELEQVVKQCKRSLVGFLDDITDAVTTGYERLVGFDVDGESQEPGAEPESIEDSGEGDATSRLVVSLGRQYNSIAAALLIKFQAEADALSPSGHWFIWGQQTRDPELKNLHREAWGDAQKIRLSDEDTLNMSDLLVGLRWPPGTWLCSCGTPVRPVAGGLVSPICNGVWLGHCCLGPGPYADYDFGLMDSPPEAGFRRWLAEPEERQVRPEMGGLGKGASAEALRRSKAFVSAKTLWKLTVQRALQEEGHWKCPRCDDRATREDRFRDESRGLVRNLLSRDTCSKCEYPRSGKRHSKKLDGPG